MKNTIPLRHLLRKSNDAPDAKPIVSFDVFETLLFRPLATPDDVNRRLARRLSAQGLSQLDEDAFVVVRREAERRAAAERSRSHESQPDLASIGEQMSKATGLPLTLIQRFLDEEVRLEGELLRPVPGALELVNGHRQRGARIAFISDMYLPAESIAAWLRREGMALENERVFVSGECGVCKGTGNLFRHVLHEMGAGPSDMLHVGNNRHADVQGAELANVASVFVDRGNLTRYEKRLAEAPGGLGGLLAGTSRAVRLQQRADLDSFESVAAGVVAPIIVSYVMWLLKQARDAGVDRLFFLSRDGQLPYRVAQKLAPKMNITIPLTYLYSSRRTWSLAALNDRTEASLNWVLEPSSFWSVRSALARAGLSPEQVEGPLVRSGFSVEQWDENVTESRRQRLAQLIVEDEEMGARLAEKKEEALALLRDYLTQVGVFDSQVVGLCDLGWHGTLQQCLRDVLSGPCQRPDIKIEGYYVAINRSERFVPSDDSRGRGLLKDAFHGPKQVGKWYRRMGFFLETFCAADHGTLLAYERRDSRVVPRLDDDFDPAKGQDLRQTLLDSALSFVDQLPVEEFDFAALEMLPLAMLQNVEAFWLTPTRREAGTWGRFPVDDRKGGSGTEDPGLAPPFDLRTAADIIRGRSASSEVAWFSGAMAQAHPVAARAVSAALKVDALRRRGRR